MALRRKPSALKHGLASRTTREAWTDEVLQLAEALLGAAPRNWAVVEAAREAAEAILYLRRVQQCRILLLGEATRGRCAPTETLKNLALQLSEAVSRGELPECEALREKFCREHDRVWLLDVEATGNLLLSDELETLNPKLRRLLEYERRAHSARRKSLRRLDYERVEAERQRPSADASSSHGKAAGCGNV